MKSTHESFTAAYVDALRSVYEAPEYKSEPRGQKIRERLCHTFSLSDPRDRLPFVSERSYSPSYMAAECLWYLAGIGDVSWIAPYAPFWTKISDDGVTVNSAYGVRIFRASDKLGIAGSQWEWVKSELTRDPDSRRAFIHIRLPRDSFEAKLDVPCTIGLQFFIRDGALHMWVCMRSLDLNLGLANDEPAFTLIQELMALELGCRLGSYTHSAGSAHVYERDFAKVDKILSASHPMSHPVPAMKTPPPIAAMLRAESQMRAATTVSDVDRAITSVAGEIDEYWADHSRLLGAFWVKKLGDIGAARDLVSRCSWSHWGDGVFRCG